MKLNEISFPISFSIQHRIFIITVSHVIIILVFIFSEILWGRKFRSMLRSKGSTYVVDFDLFNATISCDDTPLCSAKTWQKSQNRRRGSDSSSSSSGSSDDDGATAATIASGGKKDRKGDESGRRNTGNRNTNSGNGGGGVGVSFVDLHGDHSDVGTRNGKGSGNQNAMNDTSSAS